MQQDVGCRFWPAYRFVHASDVRLDTPVRGLAHIPADLRPILRDAALRAWEAVVDVAQRREAAFVLVTGGVVDPLAPSVCACTAMREGVRRLRARGIETVCVLAPDEAAHLRPWLAGARIVLPGELAVVARGGTPVAVVQACAGGERMAQPPAAGVAIGVLPAGTAPAEEHLREDGATVERQYWVAGGAGAATVLAERPWLVCAGTPQGRGLQDGERGPQGCMVAHVAAGRVERIEHVALDSVRFISIEVDLDTLAPDVELVDHCRAALDGGGRADVVIAEAVLRGDGAYGHVPRPAALLAALRTASHTPEARVWWARVRGHPVVRARPAGGPDLRSILIAQSQALGAPLPRSRFLGRTFAPLLHRGDVEVELAEQREVVQTAAALALQALDAAGLP